MAIISGMEAAKVDDIKPFELPIDHMAKGIEARQKRADDAKKNFGVGSTSLIFDVRDNPEDKELLNVLGNEYATEIEQELANRGGDWSNMDNSFIQALAMNKLKDPRAIHLRKANEQADAFAKAKQEREKDGFPLMFGIDATTQSLYDKDGRETNFYDWRVQRQLDYHKKMDEIFKNTAKTSKEWNEYVKANTIAGSNPNQAELDRLFLMWTSNKKTNNYEQMKSLVDEGVLLFITTSPEGTQMWNKEYQIYQRINKDKPEYQANPNKLIEDAETHAYRTIWNIMKAVAGSYMTNTVEQKLHFQGIPQTPVDNGGGRASAKGTGKEEEEIKPPIPILIDNTYTVEGAFQNVTDYNQAYNNVMSNNPTQINATVAAISKDEIRTAAELLNTTPNIHALSAAATIIYANPPGQESNSNNRNKAGVLFGDIDINAGVYDGNKPLVSHPSIAVRGEDAYSLNELQILTGTNLPVSDLVPGYGIKQSDVQNAIDKKVCFNEVDLYTYLSKQTITVDGQEVLKYGNNPAKIKKAVENLLGGDKGVFGSLYNMSTNIDEQGFLIDSDKDPTTPEILTTSITVKNEFTGLLDQYNQQLSKIDKSKNPELYELIKVKRDNLEIKINKTQYQIDLINLDNMTDLEAKKLEESRIAAKYGNTPGILFNEEERNRFSVLARNINSLRLGIENKVIDAQNMRGLQLIALSQQGIDITQEDIKRLSRGEKLDKRFELKDANGNKIKDSQGNVKSLDATFVYNVLLGNDVNKAGEVSKAIRYTESEALDAANGIGKTSLYYGANNLAAFEQDLINDKSWWKYVVETSLTGGTKTLMDYQNQAEGSLDDRKKFAEGMYNKFKNFYKDVTFQKFDWTAINKEIKDPSSKWYRSDNTDKNALIADLANNQAFINSLKVNYGFNDGEIKIFKDNIQSQSSFALTNSNLQQFFLGILGDKVQLDKPEVFHYPHSLNNVQQTYNQTFSEVLPEQIKGQTGSEDSRVIADYYQSLASIKQAYNKQLPMYIPSVNANTSVQGGKDLFEQYSAATLTMINTTMANTSDMSIRPKLIKYAEESGELSKENFNYETMNKWLVDGYNSGKPKEQHITSYSIEQYVKDNKLDGVGFTFDGYNDDASKPLNLIVPLKVSMDGGANTKPIQVEFPLHQFPMQIVSKLGLPVDKYRMMGQLTSSLKQSNGTSFTLPLMSGSLPPLPDNATSEQKAERAKLEKDGIKYMIVPNLGKVSPGSDKDKVFPVLGKNLKKGDIILLEEGQHNLTWHDVATGKAKIKIKSDNELAVFSTFEQAMEYHNTRGADPTIMRNLNELDRIKNEFFTNQGGRLSDTDAKRNAQKFIYYYGLENYNNFFRTPSTRITEANQGDAMLTVSNFKEARNKILQTQNAAITTTISGNPKDNSSDVSNTTTNVQPSIVYKPSGKELDNVQLIQFYEKQDPEFHNKAKKKQDEAFTPVTNSEGKVSYKLSDAAKAGRYLEDLSDDEFVGLLYSDVFSNKKNILNAYGKGIYKVDINGKLEGQPGFDKTTASRYFTDENSNDPKWVDPASYTNMQTAKYVKPIYTKELRNGLSSIDNLFNTIESLKGNKILIGSGARSIEDNVRTYANNLKNLTKSKHSSFNAIDISTSVQGYKMIKDKNGKWVNELDANGNKVLHRPDNTSQSLSGNKLLDYFKTPQGLNFLKDNGLWVLHHKQATSGVETYHIHLEYNPKMAGKLTDEADGYIDGNKKKYKLSEDGKYVIEDK